MTQEQKDLLLKDLCTRLPYNPMVEYKGKTYNVLGITHHRLVLCKPFMSHTLDECPLVEEAKPYLFPLSSMTEEQKKEYNRLKHNIQLVNELGYVVEEAELLDSPESFEYLIENNFDYHDLIPNGLANDATGLNIY